MQNGETPSPLSYANHFHRYFQYAASVISSYNGQEPLHLYLKKYFSLNKKHGSRDRKIISSLCYNYFRLGFGVSKPGDVQEKILLSSFLCKMNSAFLPVFSDPAWNNSIELPLHEKLVLVREKFDTANIFPFSEELGGEIDSVQFGLSFLIQPKLFARIRPGFRDIVINKIKAAGFLFEELNDDCLAFANNEKVSDVIDIDNEAVVQDYNSQRTLKFAEQAIKKQEAISIWDCCSGSGGKAILSRDIFPNSKLTVSDKRKSILENLTVRFKKAGIKNYTYILIDLQVPSLTSGALSNSFDLIIADVPCTGSGTWGRTPEQLSFFNKKETDTYAALQRKIVQNAALHLAAHGFLLYITCSVFRKENEENVAFFQKNLQLNLVKMEYLKGYEMQADTLFVALFKTRTSDPPLTPKGGNKNP